MTRPDYPWYVRRALIRRALNPRRLICLVRGHDPVYAMSELCCYRCDYPLPSRHERCHPGGGQ